jgi:hypothetical protein
VRFPALVLMLLLTVACAAGGSVADYVEKVAPLIDPAKLATLKERGANPRVQKYTYWLWMAKVDGVNPATVVSAALQSVGMTNKLAVDLTKATMLRNVTTAERLGCFDKAGLEEMRKGNAATVRRGLYAGDQLSVDHIIPRAVVPELDNVIANLELLPQRANSKKNASVGQRQRDLAQKLYQAGLLTETGLRSVGARKHFF